MPKLMQGPALTLVPEPRADRRDARPAAPRPEARSPRRDQGFKTLAEEFRRVMLEDLEED